jgi:hypothetical protein
MNCLARTATAARALRLVGPRAPPDRAGAPAYNHSPKAGSSSIIRSRGLFGRILVHSS